MSNRSSEPMEEMVHSAGVTATINYMLDPTMKSAQMPPDAYNGSVAWG
jgi:hypothetical protein